MGGRGRPRTSLFGRAKNTVGRFGAGQRQGMNMRVFRLKRTSVLISRPVSFEGQDFEEGGITWVLFNYSFFKFFIFIKSRIKNMDFHMIRKQNVYFSIFSIFY